MKAIINDREFQVELAENKNTIDGKPYNPDIAEIAKGRFHVLVGQQSFSAEIVEQNREEKTVTVKINQNVYHVRLKDKYDDLLHQLGLDESNAKKGEDVKAPMPGLVIQILVEPGQKVTKGDAILVLEAMKMENILKAASDGEVKKIVVKKGDKVEKNQVMVHFI